MIQIDMPMPEHCYDCPICYDGYYCPIAKQHLDFATCDIQRMDFCPLEVVPETNVEKWINGKNMLPPEHETIFAKFKGIFEDGTRMLHHDHTIEGKWSHEMGKCAFQKCIVTHWMPNPDLPKEENGNG